MWVRALLVCDDVRLEVGGTLTVVGVHGDRIVVDVGEGPIVLNRLVILAIVAGLTGIDRVGVRYGLGEGGASVTEPMTIHARDAARDEHQFVHLISPVQFDGPGTWQVSFELEAGGHRSSLFVPLRIERARPPSNGQVA